MRNQENIKYPLIDKSSFRNIKSVTPVDTVPTKCLEVESPTHTFLVGRNLLVTHNTNKELFDESKPLLYHIDPSYGLRQDNYGKYCLQFSFYQLLLELKGFEVEDRVLIWLNEDKENKKLYRTFRTPNLTQEILKHKNIWSPVYSRK